MKEAGITSLEKQEETINSMIETLAELEDFESAERLKNDWTEYKEKQDEQDE
jgi:pentatricopeptide repeat protein